MLIPHLIKRSTDGSNVEIQWDDHGHTAVYGARDLRLACQCATCREEMSRRPILDPASVREDVRVTALSLVGGYAVHFTFSDGHATGIYPWDYLLGICPCPRCAAERAGAT